MWRVGATLAQCFSRPANECHKPNEMNEYQNEYQNE